MIRLSCLKCEDIHTPTVDMEMHFLLIFWEICRCINANTTDKELMGSLHFEKSVSKEL